MQGQCSIPICHEGLANITFDMSCFLLSGYGDAYRVCDPLNPRSCDEDTAADRSLAGGKVFSNAWMYDGNQWNDLPAMSTPRDRPACSLVESDNGEVSYRKKHDKGSNSSK